jgi:hypothetical protein
MVAKKGAPDFGGAPFFVVVQVKAVLTHMSLLRLIQPICRDAGMRLPPLLTHCMLLAKGRRMQCVYKNPKISANQIEERGGAALVAHLIQEFLHHRGEGLVLQQEGVVAVG